MQTQNKNDDMNFDFNVLERKPTSEQESESLMTTSIHTIFGQFNTLFGYILGMVLILRLTSVDLYTITLMLSTMIIISKSIVQSLSYVRKKSLKNQLVNGFVNIGMCLYFFQGNNNGFNYITNMTKQLVSAFIF